MSSMTTYSPYETLAFFQSVARYGAHPSALQDISTTLKQNEYIREHATFDANRLSANALKTLYDEFIAKENGKSDGTIPFINGGADTGERSPKRRKLDPAPQPQANSSHTDQKLIDGLVNRLYEEYKQDVVREIKKNEEVYIRLQDEIKDIELRVKTETTAAPKDLTTSTDTPTNDSFKATDVDHRNSSTPVSSLQSSQHSQPNPEAQHRVPAVIPTHDTKPLPKPHVADAKAGVQAGNGASATQSRPATPQASSLQPTPTSSHQPTSSFPRQQLAAPHRPMYGPVQPQSSFAQTSSAQLSGSPHVAVSQQRPAPRAQQGNNHGRGSPIPYQNQHPYPPYPPYPPPQWHPHMPPQQYQQHSPYGPPQYYQQPSNGRHPQTPPPVPYMPYPHTAPVQYMQPQQWRGQQWPAQQASLASTPISRPDSRLSTIGSRSSTPWKRTQQNIQARQKSPSRPERAESPLTDTEGSPVPKNSKPATLGEKPKLQGDETPTQRLPRRRGRPPSITPSAMVPSRSQSIASRASDSLNEKQFGLRHNHKIKAETPSTPVPSQPPETEQQRHSGGRGRPRSGTNLSQSEATKATTTKRKRGSMSPSPSTHSPNPLSAIPPSHHIAQSHDPTLLVVSKNFSKTSQLLLNEITSHKLAGIFAKPLSERDAPGYKHLVLRPQDLKSIKAAISKGGRAALAVIESLESEGNIIPINAQSSTATGSSVGAIGNGFYLVPKTAELLPPKGIVNSAQLEMELVRMFANAVMFNPLPSSERGFGRNLRPRKNGGNIDMSTGSDNDSVTEDSDDGSSSGIEEDGIIADAREMFKDVVELVGKWRELEGERMGAGAGTDAGINRTGNSASSTTLAGDGGRQASMSVSSNIGDDEAVMGESEIASTPVTGSSAQGTARKRRRVGDH